MIVELGANQWATKKAALLAHTVNDSNKYVPTPFKVARASTGTYIGRDGLLKTAQIDEPRIEFLNEPNGYLLTEPQSTNLYLNSNVLVTQGVTTLASEYTISFKGTGTITFTGSYSGSLVGVGSLDTDIVTITFTATVGTLTSTVSGTVENAQCENLGYRTSFILTSGATTTRIADAVTDCGNEFVFNSSEGVLYAECSVLNDTLTDRYITLSDGTLNNRVNFRFSQTSNTIQFTLVVGGVTQADQLTNTYDLLALNKFAMSWKFNEFKIFVNGAQYGVTDITVTAPPSGTFNRLDFMRGDAILNFYGKTKALRTYPTALTDAELTKLTTVGQL